MSAVAPQPKRKQDIPSYIKQSLEQELGLQSPPASQPTESEQPSDAGGQLSPQPEPEPQDVQEGPQQVQGGGLFVGPGTEPGIGSGDVDHGFIQQQKKKVTPSTQKSVTPPPAKVSKTGKPSSKSVQGGGLFISEDAKPGIDAGNVDKSFIASQKAQQQPSPAPKAALEKQGQPVPMPELQMFDREVLPQMGPGDQGAVEVTSEGFKYHGVPVKTYRERFVKPKKDMLGGLAMDVARAPEGSTFMVGGEKVSQGQAISAIAAASKGMQQVSGSLKQVEGKGLVVQSTDEGERIMSEPQLLRHRLEQAGPEEREALEEQLVRERFRPAEYKSVGIGGLELFKYRTRPPQVKKGGEWQDMTIPSKRMEELAGKTEPSIADLGMGVFAGGIGIAGTALSKLKDKSADMSVSEAREQMVVEELMQTPSQIKEQYYKGLGTFEKGIEIGGGTFVSAAAWPVTLPETVGELAASKITGKKTDILPLRETLGAQYVGYGEGARGQGLIGASISTGIQEIKQPSKKRGITPSAVGGIFGPIGKFIGWGMEEAEKEQPSPLGTAFRHPVEAGLATGAELAGLWAGGKVAGAAVRGAGRGIRRLSDYQVESSLVRGMARRQTMREMGVQSHALSPATKSTESFWGTLGQKATGSIDDITSRIKAKFAYRNAPTRYIGRSADDFLRQHGVSSKFMTGDTAGMAPYTSPSTPVGSFRVTGAAPGGGPAASYSFGPKTLRQPSLSSIAKTRLTNLGKHIKTGVQNKWQSSRMNPYAGLPKEGQQWAWRLERFHRKALRPMVREEVQGLQRVPYLYPVHSRAQDVQIPIDQSSSLTNRIWGNIQTKGMLTGKRVPYRTSLFRRMTIHKAMKPMIAEQARPLTTMGVMQTGPAKRTIRVRSIKGSPREVAVASAEQTLPEWIPSRLYTGAKKVWSGVQKSRIPLRRPRATMTNWRWITQQGYKGTGRLPATHSTSSIWNQFSPGDVITRGGGATAAGGGEGGAGYLLKYLGRQSGRQAARAASQSVLRLPALGQSGGMSALTAGSVLGAATLPRQADVDIDSGMFTGSVDLPSFRSPSIADLGVQTPSARAKTGKRWRVRQPSRGFERGVVSPVVDVGGSLRDMGGLSERAISGVIGSSVRQPRARRPRTQIGQRGISMPRTRDIFDVDIDVGRRRPSSFDRQIRRQSQHLERQFTPSRLQRSRKAHPRPMFSPERSLGQISAAWSGSRLPSLMARGTERVGLTGKSDIQGRMPRPDTFERFAPGLVQQPDLSGRSVEKMLQEQQLEQRQALVGQERLQTVTPPMFTASSMSAFALPLPSYEKKKKKRRYHPDVFSLDELRRKRQYPVGNLLAAIWGGK